MSDLFVLQKTLEEQRKPDKPRKFRNKIPIVMAVEMIMCKLKIELFEADSPYG